MNAGSNPAGTSETTGEIMGKTQDLKNGAVIKFNGENCLVLENEHIKPGKGPAYIQVKLRNMNTGKLYENRFNSGASIEFVRIERLTFQYLYNDGQSLIFMNNENYEQIPIDPELITEGKDFLKENEEVQIAFEGDVPLSVEIPQHVNLVITQTEPGFKGDTATNVMKPAIVETGATVPVPLFINEGDKIRIDTRTGSYIERIKD